MSLYLAATFILAISIIGCREKPSIPIEPPIEKTPSQEFGKRDWNQHPPKTDFEQIAYIHETFQKSRRRGVLESELEIHDASGKIVGILKTGLMIHSPGIDDVADTDLSDNNREKVLFDLPIAAKVKWLEEVDQQRFAETWHRNPAVVASRHDNSEQTSPGQPATRPVDEPEGGDKPQPEAEGRDR